MVHALEASIGSITIWGTVEGGLVMKERDRVVINRATTGNT